MSERRKASVLLLEDDEALLALFDRILNQAGFDFKIATTGGDAADLFARKRYDLLVCDLSVLGGGNVFNFISSLRSRDTSLAVLIITGYTPADVASRAESLGLDLLEKPFSPPEFLSRISLLLGPKAA